MHSLSDMPLARVNFAVTPEEDFDGAGPATSLNLEGGSYGCSKCNRSYPFYGCLAAMKKPEYREFYRHLPAAVTRTIAETKGDKFQSIGSGEGGQVAELGLVCYKCAGKAIKDDEMHFVNLDKNKLTSGSATWRCDMLCYALRHGVVT